MEDVEKELENSRLQVQLAKMETELAKKDVEVAKKDVEVTKAQYQKELLETQIKYERLEMQLRQNNWEHIKTNKQIYVRSFFKMFGQKHLRNLAGDWETRLRTFLKTKVKALDEWHFEGTAYFEDIYWDLFNHLNKNAHPLFIKSDSLEVPNNLFEKSDLRLLGFLWDMCEYPLNNFRIDYGSKPAESIAVLKKGHNPN